MRRKGFLFLISTVPCLPLLYIAVSWLQESAVPPGHSEWRRGNTVESPPKHLLLREIQKPLQQEPAVGPVLAAPQPPPNPLHMSDDGDDEDDNMYKISPNDLSLSEYPDIDKRGKFQQQRISEMCRKHFFSREQKLPLNEELRMFFRHLMFDDKREAIFCFVPKIGCTDMKRLMLYMGGHLPLSTVSWPWVEDSVYLEPALSRASLLNATLTTSEKMRRLKTYFKFTVVRNPLERLVSGYRNKIEPPLNFDRRDRFPESVKLRILERYRSSTLHQWTRVARENRSQAEISVSFQEFVQYYVETDVMEMNEHFRPAIDICHPCLTRYDFYANFRNYSSDVALLIQRFRTERRFYRDKSLHSSSEQTSGKLEGYYGRLNHRDKMRLLGKMYDDLLFYYTLYPADRDSHRRLLGVSLDIS